MWIWHPSLLIVVMLCRRQVALVDCGVVLPSISCRSSSVNCSLLYDVYYSAQPPWDIHTSTSCDTFFIAGGGAGAAPWAFGSHDGDDKDGASSSGVRRHSCVERVSVWIWAFFYPVIGDCLSKVHRESRVFVPAKNSARQAEDFIVPPIVLQSSFFFNDTQDPVCIGIFMHLMNAPPWQRQPVHGALFTAKTRERLNNRILWPWMDSSLCRKQYKSMWTRRTKIRSVGKNPPLCQRFYPPWPNQIHI